MKVRAKRLYQLRDKKSFREVFEQICSYGNDISCEYYEKGSIRKITHTEFRYNTISTSHYLSELLGKPDGIKFVGLHIDNCWQWPVLFWGILMAGYNPILLDFRASKETLQNLLQESNAVAIITTEKEKISSEVKQYLVDDIVRNDIEELEDWTATWGNQIAFCTSGTTSNSKIFAYEEKALIENVTDGWKVSEASPFFNNFEIVNHGEFRLLAFLPFYHIFGFFAYFGFSVCNTLMVYLPDRAPKTIMETCKRHNVSHLFAVPLMWNNLINKIIVQAKQKSWFKYLAFRFLCEFSYALQLLFPIRGARFAYNVLFRKIHKKILGTTIKCIVSGGACLSPRTLKMLTSLGFPVLGGFGMTEIGVITVEGGEHLLNRITGCVGELFAQVETKIVPVPNLKTKKGIGELYVRAPYLHYAQIQEGKISPAIRTEDGWFATGDLARVTKKRRLYILGRCKDTIIPASGENVYPEELEAHFQSLQGKESLCILGLKNQNQSEDISLIVYIGKNVCKQDEISIAHQIHHLNRKLSLGKKITHAFISPSPLPITTSMKIQRQKLKNLIEEGKWCCRELDITTIKEQASLSIQKKNEDEEIREKVREIFAKILCRSPKSISDEDHFIEDLGGDSLEAISLAGEIEKAFHVFIPDSVLLECSNVKDISQVVEAQLKGKTEGFKISEAPEKRKPIYNFEESREFQIFTQRKQIANVYNPYFLRHDSVVKDTSWLEGKTVINFASYNYLGLSGSKRVVKATQEAVAKYGTSASGSRLLTGEKTLYRELEKELAEWKHVEDSIVLVSGHATNVTFVGNFCNEHDLILYDALSHNSIEQGCRLSRSESKAFPHNDFDALEAILKARRDYYEKVLIIVEGVYSMDGDIAPIPSFVKLKKKYNCFLMVDEAHSTGVLGSTGRGVDEHFALESDDIDIRMGTLSKGLGSCGGYLAGRRGLIDYLRYNLPGFVFSVGLPPASAAAALEGIRILKEENSRIRKLQKNIDIFLEEAHRRKLNTCLAQRTAIIPILVKNEEVAFMLCKRLKEEGVFVAPAVYPAVPKNQARLRFCVTSEHKQDQIVKAMDLILEIAEKEKIDLPTHPAAATVSA